MRKNKQLQDLSLEVNCVDNFDIESSGTEGETYLVYSEFMGHTCEDDSAFKHTTVLLEGGDICSNDGEGYTYLTCDGADLKLSHNCDSNCESCDDPVTVPAGTCTEGSFGQDYFETSYSMMCVTGSASTVILSFAVMLVALIVAF